MLVITRDPAPDVLRGFALWGIVLVNVAYFSSSVDSGVTADALANAGDSVAAFLVFALAQEVLLNLLLPLWLQLPLCVGKQLGRSPAVVAAGTRTPRVAANTGVWHHFLGFNTIYGVFTAVRAHCSRRGAGAQRCRGLVGRSGV